MATAKRFSYSLLISTLAFAVFAVFAFSGLFPWIETQFYRPKVVSDLQSQLMEVEDRIEAWKTASVGKLDQLLSDQAFADVFSPTASQETLQRRFQASKLFLLGIRGGASLRLFNGDLSQLHFSSVEADVKVRTDFSLTYRLPNELTDLPNWGSVPSVDSVRLLLDPSGLSVSFLRPWSAGQGSRGVALLSVSLEDLRMALLEAGAVWTHDAPVALSADAYLFSALGQRLDVAVVGRVRELQSQGVLPPVQRLGEVNGRLSVALVHAGNLSLAVPEEALQLHELLKYVLLVSFYSVVFLVTFLLANLRGEPLSVVTRKVKRFQLQVVRQYLDLKEQDKIQSLRDELARHSEEIRTDVRKSLGRVRKRDQEWVDRYIDTSWQEVMDLLRGPSPPAEESSSADWKRLETLLQQALTQGRFVVSGTAPVPVPTQPRAEPAVDVAEVEDLEEAEEVEEAEEFEADAVEELEEAEDLEVIEDLEEVEELDEVEDLEEVDELEEADVEELEDAEPLDTADGDSTLEALPETAPLDFSRLRRVPESGMGAPVTLLPSNEVDVGDDLEELEEVLEDLEEGAEEEDFAFSLERLDAAWKSTSLEVFDEKDEVVTLKEDLFVEASENQDAFGQLVDDVLAGPDGRAFEPLEEDLLPRQLSRDWRWTGGGFDWDRFALGDDEVNLFRALSDVVTLFDAFTAAILTDQGGVWKAQSSVGFSDAGKDLLSYNPASPLSRGFLSIRALHVLKGGAGHGVLKDSFHGKDMKFLKTVLLVPLLFRHEPAWLLLGLRHEVPDPLVLLAPRRVD